MVDIVALEQDRPHFHQLPLWAQRIFAICVVTPNTKYDVRWYCIRIPSILAPGWERGGGGGTLIFSNIRRPGPFLGLTLWCFVMTPKDIHKIFIPQKLYIFLKTLKGIEIQNFEPQNGASPRMNENIIVPPPPPSTLSSQIETGAGGVQTQITEKTLIRVFFVGFFLQLFFYGSKGSKHLSGGGGGVQLFYYYFFWGGGGGGGLGVQILISIETYITCDFSGGGGGSPDHLSLSGFGHG